jgi:ubiquinone/menaquinone biosynthesis C-methylase UbiE
MGSFISFVPTPFEDIEIFFALAPATSSDTVYDLGSGDGRLLFTALKKGAGKAIGVELDLGHVHEAREAVKKKGLDARVAFLHADVMDVNLSGATLVFCYLFTTASTALKPKFAAELKPGTRIVMESFPVHGWKPIKTEYHGLKTFYLYQMPTEIRNKYEPNNGKE